MLCGITKLLKWMLKSCAIGSLCMLYAFIQDLASREMSEKKTRGWRDGERHATKVPASTFESEDVAVPGF